MIKRSRTNLMIKAQQDTDAKTCETSGLHLKTTVCSTQSQNLVSNSSYFPQVALCEAPGWDVPEKL